MEVFGFVILFNVLDYYYRSGYVFVRDFDGIL